MDVIQSAFNTQHVNAVRNIKNGITHSRGNYTDLPVDRLRQGQCVGSSVSSSGEFGAVNIARKSVELQCAEHACWTRKYIISAVLDYKFLMLN